MEELLCLGFVTISYLPKENCLVQTWHSFCTVEEFISIQEECLAFVEDNGCWAFVCDCTNAEALHTDVVRWTSNVFMNRLKKAGINQIKVVPPKSVAACITMEYFVKELGSFVHFHKTIEQALKAVCNLDDSSLSV